MTRRISLALTLHNHQPIGNFGWVFAEVFDQAYRPMVEALSKIDSTCLSSAVRPSSTSAGTSGKSGWRSAEIMTRTLIFLSVNQLALVDFSVVNELNAPCVSPRSTASRASALE